MVNFSTAVSAVKSSMRDQALQHYVSLRQNANKVMLINGDGDPMVISERLSTTEPA